MALSAAFDFRTCTDGVEWGLTADHGRSAALRELERCGGHHGTALSFQLDAALLPHVDLKSESVESLARQATEDGLSVIVRDHRLDSVRSFPAER